MSKFTKSVRNFFDVKSLNPFARVHETSNSFGAKQMRGSLLDKFKTTFRVITGYQTEDYFSTQFVNRLVRPLFSLIRIRIPNWGSFANNSPTRLGLLDYATLGLTNHIEKATEYLFNYVGENKKGLGLLKIAALLLTVIFLAADVLVNAAKYAFGLLLTAFAMTIVAPVHVFSRYIFGRGAHKALQNAELTEKVEEEESLDDDFDEENIENPLVKNKGITYAKLLEMSNVDGAKMRINGSIGGDKTIVFKADHHNDITVPFSKNVLDAALKLNFCNAMTRFEKGRFDDKLNKEDTGYASVRPDLTSVLQV